MSEWIKEHAWRACRGLNPPSWVRIPVAPFSYAPENKRMLSRRSTKWVVSWIFAGALLTASGVCGAFFYHLHQQNGALQHLRLPRLAAPGPSSAILVLAPHCDDETLGTGGMLAEAVRAGARVRVVLLTNGDGFRVAAARRYHK